MFITHLISSHIVFHSAFKYVISIEYFKSGEIKKWQGKSHNHRSLEIKTILSVIMNNGIFKSKTMLKEISVTAKEIKYTEENTQK
jgi:hypothetical protein